MKLLTGFLFPAADLKKKQNLPMAAQYTTYPFNKMSITETLCHKCSRPKELQVLPGQLHVVRLQHRERSYFWDKAFSSNFKDNSFFLFFWQISLYSFVFQFRRDLEIQCISRQLIMFVPWSEFFSFYYDVYVQYMSLYLPSYQGQLPHQWMYICTKREIYQQSKVKVSHLLKIKIFYIHTPCLIPET